MPGYAISRWVSIGAAFLALIGGGDASEYIFRLAEGAAMLNANMSPRAGPGSGREKWNRASRVAARRYG